MSEKYKSVLNAQRQKIVDFVGGQIENIRMAEKIPRRRQNIKNWRYFHGNIDWSYKKRGDARIHLHKVGVAAERHRAKFKQNLVKFSNWMSVELEDGMEPQVLTPWAARNFTIRALERAKGKTKLSDAILNGEMEGRATLRVGWKKQIVPKFVAKGTELRKVNNMKGQLAIDVRDFEQYFKDIYAVDNALFDFEQILVDYHEVLALSADEPTAAKPYRMEAVKSLSNWREREEDDARKESEGNRTKHEPFRGRKRLAILNFYGTILGEDGEVMEWEKSDGSKVPMKNVLVTLGNETEVLRDPVAIPRWSGNSPFVSADLLRSPQHGIKAIMDAGTDLNEAENELFSMMLTGAYKATHNVTWYRKDWISDEKKLSGGVKDGDSIPVDSDAPPNADVMGTMQTGKVPQEAFNMLGLIQRAFAENVFSNLLDLSGNMPTKQVRATEVQESRQAIGDIFESLAQDIEEELIEPFLQECFLEVMQNSNDLSEEEIRAAFGEDVQGAEMFLKMTPQERFADAAGNFRFVAKGLRGQLASSAKAQAMINYLNTLTANPVTLEAVQSQISIPKISKLIGKGLGLDEEEYATSERERRMIETRQLIREAGASQDQQPGQVQPQQGTAPAPEQPGPEEGI
jgi:hypothetical protein